jgi:hypothetical protein
MLNRRQERQERIGRGRALAGQAGLSVHNLGPIVRVDVPKENPPAGRAKGFRLGHSDGAVDHVPRVGLILKILLSVPANFSHHVHGERLVRPQNQDVAEAGRDVFRHIRRSGRLRPEARVKLTAKHMSKSHKPNSADRPAHVIGTAGQDIQIATGHATEMNGSVNGKNKAAVELGRRGGYARAKRLSAERRREIARRAARARWGHQNNQPAPSESKKRDRSRHL